MRPKPCPQDAPSSFQLFQSRLENMVNLEHPLVHLAHAIQWERTPIEISPFFADSLTSLLSSH